MEDKEAELKIYWHYWTGSPEEMLGILEVYKKKVIFNLANCFVNILELLQLAL